MLSQRAPIAQQAITDRTAGIIKLWYNHSDSRMALFDQPRREAISRLFVIKNNSIRCNGGMMALNQNDKHATLLKRSTQHPVGISTAEINDGTANFRRNLSDYFL